MRDVEYRPNIYCLLKFLHNFGFYLYVNIEIMYRKFVYSLFAITLTDGIVLLLAVGAVLLKKQRKCFTRV